MMSSNSIWHRQFKESNPTLPDEPIAWSELPKSANDDGPEGVGGNGYCESDELEPVYGAIGHPNHVADLHLLRPAIGNANGDGDSKSTIRMTIQPFLTTKDDVVFYPIIVELASNGPSVRLARHPRRPRGPHSFHSPSKTEPGRLEFKSRTITRVCHCQMWFEDGKVLVQDTGSSNGTFLNGKRLVGASTVSPPYEIKDGDIIQVGRDYEPGLKSDAENKSIFKCIKAKLYIEPCAMETPDVTAAPTLEPEALEAPPAEVASITFDCLPNCACPWRALFHTKEIYSIHLAVPNLETISSAIEAWLLSKKGASDKWAGWEEDDVVLLMSVIESIIEAMKTTSQDFQSYQSWIRKIARETGALPPTFVLKGVTRTSDYAVSGGGFSDIYVGRHGGRVVALKVLRVFMTPENRKRVFREVAHEALFWKHMEHSHILPFLGISREALEPQLSLVSPWMPNGNILCYMEDHDDVPDRLSLVTQCSQGLRYLHEHTPGLIHGDIKAANILIDEEGNARLTDFGLITITESQAIETEFTAHTGRGSVRWMAPELFGSGVRINRSTDVYAFGMTTHEIYTNSAPFAGCRNDFQVIMAITQGIRPTRPSEVGMYEDLWSLVTRCWEIEPSARPCMKEVEDSLICLMERRTRGELVRPDSSLSSNTRTAAYGDASYDTR